MIQFFEISWAWMSVVAIGVVIMFVHWDGVMRSVGVGLVAAGLFFGLATAAHADQALTVVDNGSVDCVASAHDLTRISLVGDEFASVSKVTAVDPLDDFNVVNEPTRGDIYVGIPEGFKRKNFSFFGTSKRGFVYKFSCRVDDVGAQQIFLSNPRMAELEQAEAEPVGGDIEAPDLEEVAIRLIQAMANDEPMAGFRREISRRVAVRSGELSVQLVVEYVGVDLVGRVVRVENTGSKSVVLSEEMVAPADAFAVSIGNPSLAESEATGVYVVMEKGSAR